MTAGSDGYQGSDDIAGDRAAAIAVLKTQELCESCSTTKARCDIRQPRGCCDACMHDFDDDDGEPVTIQHVIKVDAGGPIPGLMPSRVETAPPQPRGPAAAAVIVDDPLDVASPGEAWTGRVPQYNTSPLPDEVDLRALLVDAGASESDELRAYAALAWQSLNGLYNAVEVNREISEAQARITAAEEELGAAREALRVAKGRSRSDEQTAAMARARAASQVPAVCRKGCGRSCASLTGRAAHERHCDGTPK